MDQSRLPLWEKVKTYQDSERAWLHVPGHGGGPGLPADMKMFASMARFDLTELPELDDLHAPGGAIAEAQRLAADVWRADSTYFLVNGSTAGVLAMVLACCAPGDTILAARNAHGSFYHALLLSGAVPRYLPVTHVCGVPLNVTVDAVRAAFAQNPNARALFLTSPGYHGACADIAEIAAIVHRHGALLLLDEAHGAHLGFSRKLPASQGHLADVRVQSWHKTLGALTPGAVLHQQGSLLDQGRLRAALQWVQTSSPSYPLLLSLDAVRRQMALDGVRITDRMAETAAELRRVISTHLPVLSEQDLTPYGLCLDKTRISMLTGKAGICGLSAAEMLTRQGIDTELSQPAAVLAVVGPGYQEQYTGRIERALAALLKSAPACAVPLPDVPEPDVVLPPREGYYRASQLLTPREAYGCIAADTVVSYPPGQPLLVPGERVTKNVVAYIEAACHAGVRFRGLDGDGRIRVSLSAT